MCVYIPILLVDSIYKKIKQETFEYSFRIVLFNFLCSLVTMLFLKGHIYQ